MREDKLSEFIYLVHLEHDTASYGIYNFKTFYDRASCMAYSESLAANNLEMSVQVDIRPRFRKHNTSGAGGLGGDRGLGRV
jgi:hypothetical protein